MSQTDPSAAASASTPPGSFPAAPLADCQIETMWRRIPQESAAPSPTTIRTARWKSGPLTEPIAHSNVNADCYVAAVVLAPGRSTLRVDGLTVHDGAVTGGLTQITAPMQETHAASAHPCDVFHLFIPPSLIDRAMDGRGTGGTHLIGRTPRIDPVLFGAISTWIDIQGEGGDDRALYAECLGQMILHRITGSHLRMSTARPPVGPLQSWRLRRALDYVEANLDRTVTLRQMATAAELSPMHFAAQFRRAMGTTPYRYVLRRRIERAQSFIRQNDHTLGDIAMMTGFSSQAHFSTAFRATIGTTPRSWRETILVAAPEPGDVGGRAAPPADEPDDPATA
jgi:AraC family transcriptional regulator